MTDTQFSMTIRLNVEAYGRDWPLKATVSPKGWGCEPVILWLENDFPDAPYWVAEGLWDLAQAQLDDENSDARAAFEAAMNRAPVPFLAAAE